MDHRGIAGQGDLVDLVRRTPPAWQAAVASSARVSWASWRSLSRGGGIEREPNDSTNGFCQGEPGSMKLRPLPPRRHQSRTAFAVISGPLSIRTSSGATPRSRTIWSSTRTAWSASIERATRIAKASRVCSSTTWSSFKVRPSTVVSNWKSNAQTWFGRSARSRFAGTVESPSRTRFRLRCGTRSPSSRHSRWIFLRFTAQPSSRRAPQASR